MHLKHAFTVPKADDIPNEDQYAKGDTFALSDGASISYDSALWAHILCARYVQSPQVTQDWLDACIEEFNNHHVRATMPPHKEIAFDRGSFASLLGVRATGASIHIDAIGDSLAILCDGNVRKDSFPYREVEQFEQAPMLLCTDPAKNPIFADGVLAGEWMHDWSLELLQLQSPRLLCMTDALGQWLLSREGNDSTEMLFSLETNEAFAQFVLEQREAGGLKRDDTTLLVFG
jgi:hypothetical protein